MVPRPLLRGCELLATQTNEPLTYVMTQHNFSKPTAATVEFLVMLERLRMAAEKAALEASDGE